MHESESPPLLSRPAKLLIGLNRLARPDIAMVGVLLLVYAAAHPYSGFSHDARLYQLQVLNRVEPERFSGDLFLKFGSQDRFSLFSTLMAPLVRVTGITVAFFIGYFCCVSSLLYAEVQLIRRLVGVQTLANFALILMAASTLYFGYQTISIQESYLTARMPAHACCILGFAYALDKRWGAAFSSFAIAMCLHPLISIGPLCVLVMLCAANRFPTKKVVIGFGAAIVVVLVLLMSPLSSLAFSSMDAAWYAVVYDRNPMCFLSKWHREDWLRTIMATACIIIGLRELSGDNRKLLVFATMIAFAGLAVTAIGEMKQTAFLLAGQGFRATWMLSLFSIPLGLLAIRNMIRRPSPLFVTCSILIGLYIGNETWTMQYGLGLMSQALIWWLIASAIFWLVVPLALPPAGVSWTGRVWTAVVSGLIAMNLYFGLKYFFAIHHNLEPESQSSFLTLPNFLKCQPRFLFGVVAVVAFGALGQMARRYPRSYQSFFRSLGIGAATIWMSIHFITTPNFISPGQDVLSAEDLTFAKSVLSEHPHASIEVYWPNHLREVWIELGARCYYDYVQLAGAVFSRETALEGKRRTELVRLYEIEIMRRNPDHSIRKSVNLKWLECPEDLSAPPPNADDLLQLAADETLDFIILEDEFPGLYAATNGSVWIYDCRELRRRFGGPQLAGADDLR